jgi:hypothetical protein
MGATLHYGILSASFWFLFVILNILQHFIQDSNPMLSSRVHRFVLYIYPTISWGVPLIFVVIALAKSYYGVNGDPFCTVMTIQQNNLIFIPLAVIQIYIIRVDASRRPFIKKFC